jgi:hypothetical protein
MIPDFLAGFSLLVDVIVGNDCGGGAGSLELVPFRDALLLILSRVESLGTSVAFLTETSTGEGSTVAGEGVTSKSCKSDKYSSSGSSFAQ